MKAFSMDMTRTLMKCKLKFTSLNNSKIQEDNQFMKALEEYHKSEDNSQLMEAREKLNEKSGLKTKVEQLLILRMSK